MDGKSLGKGIFKHENGKRYEKVTRQMQYIHIKHNMKLLIISHINIWCLF